MSNGSGSSQPESSQSVLEEIGLTDPGALARLMRGLSTSGIGIASGLQIWEPTCPDREAVRDEEGSLTYHELSAQAHRVGAALARRGARPGASLGLLARNHRAFIRAACGITLVGADVVLLNTAFAGPQLCKVAEREGVELLIYDEEFEPLLADYEGPRLRTGGKRTEQAESLDDLATEELGDWTPADRIGSSIILTSGTTGVPKGARRRERGDRPKRGGLGQVDTIRRIRLHCGDRVFIASPLFHAWGAHMLMVTLLLGGTLVLAHRADPELLLATIDRERIDALIGVPILIQRMLNLEPEIRDRYRTDTLRSVALSGSALPGPVGIAWMDAFGDNLHNLYGSTETGPVSIAGPEDLRAAPETAGCPPDGIRIRILDESGRELPTGEPGRIFVSSWMAFDEYTGGGSKEAIDGYMRTGDVGYVDEQGRLFVSGRDDEMIVSGGENVFPSEVESLLAEHPAIDEVALIGVPDAEFGARLRAYVVRARGSSLTVDDVRNHVRSHLARYKVPRDVVFLDELPRNPAGKVLKRVLRETASDDT